MPYYHTFQNVWPYFAFNEIVLLETPVRWRAVAKLLKISKEGRLRLEWLIYRFDGHTPTEACRHFGIKRKTFYKWCKYFDPDNLYTLNLLQDRSRSPNKKRLSTVTPLEESRIVALRTAHLRWGKMKLARIYLDRFGEKISSWKVQRIIERFGLYFQPEKTAAVARKRQRGQKKKRITELKLNLLPAYEKTSGYIICLDTIELRLMRAVRYILPLSTSTAR